MKIYPSPHEAAFNDQISIQKLPLAYVYNDDVDRLIDIKIDPEFNKPYSETALLPYQTLDTNELFIFDKNNKKIQYASNYIRQINGVYTVFPQTVKEFYPAEFTYNVLVERNDTYHTTSTYHIDLCFDYDTLNMTKIGSAFASLIANKGAKRRYPSNIILNGGDVTLTTFVNLLSLQDSCDLLCKEASKVDVNDIGDALNSHINLWLYDDSFDGAIAFSEDPANAQYELENNQIFSSALGTLKPASNKTYPYFDTENSWSVLEDLDLTPVSFFVGNNPIRILKKTNGGFLILSHTSFLENLNTEQNNDAHLRLFFEILLYVYLHSYYQTNTRTSWITDEPVDYYINLNHSYQLCHPSLNLNRILTEEKYDISHTYRIVNVTAAPKNDADEGLFQVTFIKQNRFNELIFKKESLGTAKDPAKGNNILIYTMHKSLLICKADDIVAKRIESGVQIRIIDNFHIGISPVKSSTYQINTEEEQILDLKTVGDYNIVYRDGSFYNNGNGIVVARISVTANTDVVYKDIRRLGGGEASEIPNYEMIDTGNRYGRPYRYGCPMIIQLPGRFKPMKEQIRSEVDKHIASGDYPIILYEE